MARAQFNPNSTFQPIRGAAYLTGLSAGYIRAGCKAGTIPHVKAGKDYRINMPLWLARLNAQSQAMQKDGVSK